MAKKVTFTLSAEIVAEATSALLLGDFNNWDYNGGTSLKKQKDGSFAATIALEEGKTYEYRYLLNDGRWVNDHKAEHFAPVAQYQVENCVINVPVATETAPKAKKAKAAVKVAAVEPVTESADDLTKIEGIGKKIAELLANADITTYASLSKATAKKLKTILEAAGSKFNVHDPATWPKQAKLAATGKWEELAKLQDELKGGK